MLYVGTSGGRFSASSRSQIIDDLEADLIEAAPFSALLHQQLPTSPSARPTTANAAA